MKKILVFIFVILSFYLFLNYLTKDTNLIKKILFDKVSLLNSEKNNETLKEINRIVISKQNESLFKLLSIESNKKTTLVDLEQDSPLVYIYNTHDKENYVNPDYSIYNINCNVKTASYILQDKLKEYNINSIVEERSPTNEVSKNKLDYKYTYSYSRTYLEEAIKNYPSVKIFIDLHRDGVKKEVSTAVINGTSYAKLMFFLGLGHENSKDNQKLVNDLENIIKKDYKEILRNTFIRENDSYNQDLSPNSFLIEVGGNYNTIEEVYNSLDVLAYAIKTYLEEA
ncbi:MAG: stage II sporulation protein P [bacterium]|nr:stage II sporulation protein P [bacterium]